MSAHRTRTLYRDSIKINNRLRTFRSEFRSPSPEGRTYARPVLLYLSAERIEISPGICYHDTEPTLY